MNILIVDDFALNRKMLRTILAQEGFDITEARDGLEALEKIKSRPPDVVISDILMPRMDGYRLCVEVRRDANLAHLPFIFFTSTYTSASDENLARELGGDAFLRKPTPATALIATVRNLAASGSRREVNPAAVEQISLDPEYTQRLITKLAGKNDELYWSAEELRQATGELREARDFHQAQLDSFPILVWQADADGQCRHVNRARLEFTGCTLEDEIGAGWTRSVHPEDVTELVEISRRAMAARLFFEHEYRLRYHDGSYRRVVDCGSPVHDRQGQFCGYIGACYDISERHRDEEMLRQREAQLEEAHALARSGGWDWNLEQDTLRSSPEVLRMFDLPREFSSPCSEDFLRRVHPDDRGSVEAAIYRAVTEHEPYNNEFRVVHRDGSVHMVHSRGRVTYDSAGRPISMLGVSQDVTERRLADQELTQTKARLEVLSRQLLETNEAELRRISRELHDEIGQSLTAAKLEIQAAKRMTDSPALALRLDDGLALLEHLLQSVRELSQNLRPAALDTLGLVGAVQAHVTAQTARAGLTLRFTADQFAERFDPTIEIACFRVVQEALTNVIRHAEAAQVEISLSQSDGDLHLRVRDDGRGFDCTGARARAEGGATFGLISMQERVQLAGGRFHCSSTPGRGTEVEAFFHAGPHPFVIPHA